MVDDKRMNYVRILIFVLVCIIIYINKSNLKSLLGKIKLEHIKFITYFIVIVGVIIVMFSMYSFIFDFINEGNLDVDTIKNITNLFGLVFALSLAVKMSREV
jgi:membrane associated rhomboid family serine protease